MVKRAESKEWARQYMKGIFDAPTLHETDDGEIDEESYRQWIRYELNDLKVDGLYLLAEVMEYGFCTFDEKKRLIEISLDEAKKINPKAVVGIAGGGTCPRESVELYNYAIQLGADIILVQAPYFEVAGDSAVISFYKYIAERCDIPMGLYNTLASGYIMSPQLIAELSKIPNVCALKNAIFQPYHSASVVKLTGGSIQVTEFDMFALLSGFPLGAVCGPNPLLLGQASWLLQTPKELNFNKICKLLWSGEVEEARKKYFETGVYKLWSLQVNSFDPANWVHPVSLWKYWGSLLGVPVGALRVRSPLIDAIEEKKKEVKDALLEAGLITHEQYEQAGAT